MSKLRQSIVLAWWAVVFWSVTLPVRADDSSLMGRLRRTGGAAGYQRDASAIAFSTFVGRAINGAMGLLGVIFVAQMVYAGYLWMTASGEEEQLTKAKHIIRRSIVGLAIVLGAWAITYFVISRLQSAAAQPPSAG
jgi:hypothetical protein